MPATKQVGARVLRVARDDLTTMGIEAFVYYARHDLVLGSGFGNAIFARGGAGIQEELEKLAPVETCDVVVSGAGDLESSHILHAVGPRFQEDDIEGKLRRTMQNALGVAKEKGLKAIGFPLMGTGYYGIPLDLCNRVMVEEIEKHLDGETSLEDVVICVQDRREELPISALISGA